MTLMKLIGRYENTTLNRSTMSKVPATVRPDICRSAFRIQGQTALAPGLHFIKSSKNARDSPMTCRITGRQISCLDRPCSKIQGWTG